MGPAKRCSENAVHFSVSTAYSDQRNPHPTQVAKIHENALKTIHLVWEKGCPLDARYSQSHETWSQGPTVKRLSSHWIPASQTQAAIPSPNSKNQLRNGENSMGSRRSQRGTCCHHSQPNHFLTTSSERHPQELGNQ